MSVHCYFCNDNLLLLLLLLLLLWVSLTFPFHLSTNPFSSNSFFLLKLQRSLPHAMSFITFQCLLLSLPLMPLFLILTSSLLLSTPPPFLLSIYIFRLLLPCHSVLITSFLSFFFFTLIISCFWIYFTLKPFFLYRFLVFYNFSFSLYFFFLALPDHVKNKRRITVTNIISLSLSNSVFHVKKRKQRR